jgi:hypothetical protein
VERSRSRASLPAPRARQATADPKLRLLMSSMAECVRTIAYKVRALRRRARAHPHISTPWSAAAAACGLLRDHTPRARVLPSLAPARAPARCTPARV